MVIYNHCLNINKILVEYNFDYLLVPDSMAMNIQHPSKNFQHERINTFIR